MTSTVWLILISTNIVLFAQLLWMWFLQRQILDLQQVIGGMIISSMVTATQNRSRGELERLFSDGGISDE